MRWLVRPFPIGYFLNANYDLNRTSVYHIPACPFSKDRSELNGDAKARGNLLLIWLGEG
jgi:hypothetical protein